MRSLRGRLVFLLALLVIAAVAAGALMVGLFRLSATAQAGEAEAQIGRACDAIAAAYRFYGAGWQGPRPGPGGAALRRGLTAVVQTALHDWPGIEGGIWQAGSGSLAYAFPTYQGASAKTDVPQVEISRIRGVNEATLTDDRETSGRYHEGSQLLLVTSCPLPGPVPNVTAWAMTRVFTVAGSGYQLLVVGLAILFATVLAAAALLTRLTVTWSRHIASIETALRDRDLAELPQVPATGERELDRIIMALNRAGHRLAESRNREGQLARQVAAGERLSAIGRVAAGVAHEIRNPIAAMRLKAENAIAGDQERKSQALAMILGQIARLDVLVRRLLSMTERERLNCVPLDLKAFLETCVSAHTEFARSKSLTVRCDADPGETTIDPEQMRRALENFVLNAIEAAPTGSEILIAGRRNGASLVISVHDEGPGPPQAIRDNLFEPFVTGRAGGTGLGLSIAREVAAAHGGTARLGASQAGTTFEIVVPWRPS